jgi:hypothetical protein
MSEVDPADLDELTTYFGSVEDRDLNIDTVMTHASCTKRDAVRMLIKVINRDPNNPSPLIDAILELTTHN